LSVVVVFSLYKKYKAKLKKLILSSTPEPAKTRCRRS
jgi:hypothetical protein